MNIQNMFAVRTEGLRARGAAIGKAALEVFGARSSDASSRVTRLKVSLATLRVASHELNKVARRCVSELVKQNSTIAMNAGNDVSTLARATYQRLNVVPTNPRTSRNAARRKKVAKKAD